MEYTHRKYVKWLWRGFYLGLGGIFLLFIGLILFGGIPSTERLENPKSNLATEIYAADGSLLGRFYQQNRVPVRYDELSPHLVTALISTEDERFVDHAGIDGEALVRVIGRTVLGGDSSGGGGSTISQQLAKLLFPRPELAGKNFVYKAVVMATTKFKEWITAVKIESRYTKKEIIAMYLNEFNFINGAYGIKSASEIYFSTSPDSLSTEQAALLIGMLKNPALYNPRRFPDRAKKRREVVLKQMQKNGHLTQSQYDEFRVKDLNLKFNRSTHNDGLAPYFREELRKEVKKILAERPRPDGTTYDVHVDGLKIYTTIDPNMQRYAEEAVWQHLKGLQKNFFQHWKNMDPWTYKGKATEAELELRQNAFDRLVRESDRFLILRDKMLPKAVELNLRDADIVRMLKIETDGWDVADKWLADGFINKDLFALYRRTLNSENWKTVKKEWTSLQFATKKEFDKKVKMTVFAYNPQGETDTIMSPYDSIRYHRMILQTGMLAVDPTNGDIKAWVGGPNYKYFKFDHVNSSVARQVGSTFKPFLYALSIERGVSPCQKIVDRAITFEAGTFGLYQNWTPKNANNSYSGAEYDLKLALKQSKNSISAYLMKDLGSVEPLIDFVGNMGIDVKRLPKMPSICLGAADLSVFEMTGGYTSFANQGVYTKPHFILKIEDRNGNVIYNNITERKEVMSQRTAYAMLQLLKGVVQGAGGFGNIKSEVGGKTGTTNEHADGWFMGVTPQLVVGTWVGGDDRWVRFRTIALGQGARMARPIYAAFLQKVENDTRTGYNVNAQFGKPEALEDLVILDCSQYDYSGEEESDYTTDSTGSVRPHPRNEGFGNDF